MLRLKNLKSAYFGPVDLDVPAGTCVAITGASGSGKSVLLRAITDIDPNEGEVSWQGQRRENTSAPAWRRIAALVPAETGWWADNVKAHFAHPEEAAPLIKALGLPDDALEWEVSRLSSGERHRLGLARAIASKPPVLLLDEPTGPLDMEATQNVEDLVRRLLGEETAVLLVTHDPEQAHRLAAHAYVMDNGRLREASQQPKQQPRQPPGRPQ